MILVNAPFEKHNNKPPGGSIQNKGPKNFVLDGSGENSTFFSFSKIETGSCHEK